MDDIGAPDAGIAYIYDLASTIPAVPVTMLNKLTPVAGDGFGQSIGIDGTTIVAGAPYVDTTAANRGAAYIFDLAMTLNIVPAAPGWAMLSWTPATSSDFVLQYTDEVASSNWITAPSGAANPVAIPTTNASASTGSPSRDGATKNVVAVEVTRARIDACRHRDQVFATHWAQGKSDLGVFRKSCFNTARWE